jgi:simple sugar transport system permease protein
MRAPTSRFAAGIALLSLVGLLIFFALAADNFLTPLALTNIASFAGVFGIIVVGVAMLMIGGEFDLSVGAVLAVAGFLFAILLNAGYSIWIAALSAVAAGMLLGLVNGLIVVLTGIPSFITTLGTMLTFRGIARAMGGGDFAKYTGEAPWLFAVLNGPVTRVNQAFTPAANLRMSVFWFLVIALIAGIVMGRMRFGNWVYAVGGNRDAAVAQGVPVRRVKLTLFALSGLLAAFAGVVQFAERGSIDPLRGQGWELMAVVACVIGGIPLTGGAGAVFGAVMGVFILQVLEQGLVLMGASVQIFRAIVGSILILSVMFTSWLTRIE